MENLFKVLGDENRLRIIYLLSKEDLCVCELEAILDTSQSNVSRHLSRLKNEGILTFEKKSQWIFYSLDPKFIEKNKLLYKYMLEKMEVDKLFQKDLDKLNFYKKTGMTCNNIGELNKLYNR